MQQRIIRPDRVRQSVFILFGLLIIVCQAFYTYQLVAWYRSPTTEAETPFRYNAGKRILHTEDEASQAGVRPDYEILAINGTPVWGEYQIQRLAAHAKPGQRISVQAKDQQGRVRSYTIQLAPQSSSPFAFSDKAFAAVVFVFGPWLAIVVAFVVVLSRPDEASGWVLFGLLVSFSQILIRPGTEGYLPIWLLESRGIAGSLFGCFLVLFGTHFPSRAWYDRRFPGLKWFLLAPLITAAMAARFFRILSDVHLDYVSRLPGPAALAQQCYSILTVCAVALFFVLLGLRIKETMQPDDRRRLIIFWAGMLLSCGPLFTLVFIGFLTHRDPFSVVPLSGLFPCVLCFDLFPCVLAYVVLVRRAMTLRVLARQGLQAALSRKGIVTLRFGILTISFLVLLVHRAGSLAPASNVQFVFLIGVVTLTAELLLTVSAAGRVQRSFFRDETEATENLVSLLVARHFQDSIALAQALEQSLASRFRSGAAVTYLASLDGYRPCIPPQRAVTAKALLVPHSALERVLREATQPRLVYFDDINSWVYSLPADDLAFLKECQAEIVAPLSRGDRLLGFLVLAGKDSDEPYTRSDLDLIHAAAAQAALSLENIDLASTIVGKTRESERRSAEKDAAELANKAKSDFLAQMSHELRTPLNAIIGYSEMLLEEAQDGGSDSLASDLEKIRGAGQHLLALINSILDISKIEAGKMELFLETVSVHKLLNDTVNIVKPLMRKNNNTLICEPCDGIGFMTADSVKVRQTLFNLLSNAAKFTHDGTVFLNAQGVRKDGQDVVRFQVRDTGIGMSPEQSSRLFSAFVQADKSISSKYGGTGLGLVICRHFCRMMGGDVTFVSEVSIGSTFTVELPRTVVEPGKTAPPAPVASQNRISEAAPSVLVIDDDPQVSDLIRRQLGDAGLDIVTAFNGADGICKARELRPRLIVLDILMEELDGWSVLSEIRADHSIANTPVLILSNLAESSKGGRHGVTDFLVKPPRKADLRAVLSKYLSSPDNGGPSGGEILLVDDDSGTRGVMARSLAEDGWEVLQADNGREALRILQRYRPRLIFLDLMMPVMNGMEFLKTLRSSERNWDVTVIVLTSKDLTGEERRDLHAGSVPVLTKQTFTLQQLLSEVRIHLTSEVRR